MTPTRETIARAICQDIELHGRGSGYVGGDSDLSDVCIDANCDLLSAADAVLRALYAAGLVVVPRDPTIQMLAKAAPIAGGKPSALSLAVAAAVIEHMRGPLVQDALVGIAQMFDDYRAMIAAAPDGGTK